MPRNLRPYLPGTPFHITSQIALRARLIAQDTIKAQILEYLADALEMSDALLHAYSILDNHLHLVVVQGRAPLCKLMTPLLSRMARCVHRTHKTRGRVTARRFGAEVLNSASYLREAIVYTHLNAVRARITTSPDLYRWSSHHDYIGSVPTSQRLSRVLVRQYSIFAEKEGVPSGPEDYLWYVNYRLHVDRLKELDMPFDGLPALIAGDRAWVHQYVDRVRKPLWIRPTRPDLRDIASQLVATRLPGAPLGIIKGRNGSKAVCEVRKEVILAAHQAGHSGASIAEFLNISESRVSQLTCKRLDPVPVRRSMEAWVARMPGVARSGRVKDGPQSRPRR